MNITLPRDFKSFPQFVIFQDHFGDVVTASYFFMEVWSELAYQIEIHGKVGYLDIGLMDAFEISLKVPEEKKRNILSLLLRSRLFEVEEGNTEFVFCKMFFWMNRQLDPNYVSNEAAKEFYESHLKAVRKNEARTSELLGVIDALCWEMEGRRVLPLTMNTALVTILTIDGIISRPERRTRPEFQPGLVHDAVRVAERYSEAKINAVLRRLFECRKDRKLPRTTEQILQRFDDVAFLLMPSDGWANWDKKTDVTQFKDA